MTMAWLECNDALSLYMQPALNCTSAKRKTKTLSIWMYTSTYYVYMMNISAAADFPGTVSTTIESHVASTRRHATGRGSTTLVLRPCATPR
jgi:hypothetical protein